MAKHTFPTLFGIGLGPGDPDLITLKAAKILRQVDVVFAAASTKIGGYEICPAAGMTNEKYRSLKLALMGHLWPFWFWVILESSKI